MGISVYMHHFDGCDPDILGYYDHAKRTIVIRKGMTVRQTRCVLAHEVAHAKMGHVCSDGAEERRADMMAAAMLVSPTAYAHAEAIDPDPHAIADELDVTVDVILDYQAMCLQRLGRRTYGRSWRTGISPELARKLSV